MGSINNAYVSFSYMSELLLLRVRVPVRACGRACVHVCVRVCVRVGVVRMRVVRIYIET